MIRQDGPMNTSRLVRSVTRRAKRKSSAKKP
jgi:hypothetical protein